jgi:TatD DNase family protein
MKIIDTHSHIYAEEFDNDRDDVISRARASRVERILMPNIDVSTLDRLHTVTERYAGYCVPMVGLHPTSVNENWQAELETIKLRLGKCPYVAVGEIGIDLYWDRTFEKEQKHVFEEQLGWSIEYGLPVAIHSRNAIAECIECIENMGKENLKGVFHSFGGTEEELHGILSLKNFLLGINGVVTFKNSALSAVLKQTDLSHIIVETDSPYLAPVPFRGKRNEPSYTLHVVDKLAEIYGMTSEEVGETTTKNACRLFYNKSFL